MLAVTRVIDERVNAAIGFHRFLHEALSVLCRRNVCRNCECASTSTFDLALECLEPIMPPGCKHDSSALAGEPPRRRLSYPCRCTCDYRNPSLKLSHSSLSHAAVKPNVISPAVQRKPTIR